MTNPKPFSPDTPRSRGALRTPSRETVVRSRRAGKFFGPVWLAFVIFFGLRWAGVIPHDWDGLAFAASIVAFVVVAIASLAAFDDAWQDGQKSSHPDPDVRALIDGEISITDYRLRKKLHHPGPDGGRQHGKAANLRPPLHFRPPAPSFGLAPPPTPCPVADAAPLPTILW